MSGSAFYKFSRLEVPELAMDRFPLGLRLVGGTIFMNFHVYMWMA